MSIGTLSLACLLLLSPEQADLFPLNKYSFKLPIDLPKENLAGIKEVVLFKSIDQGKQWNQVAKVSPEEFQKSAPNKPLVPIFVEGDGIYWFTVAAVYQDGRQDPEDIAKVPPGQKLLVKTTLPTAQLTAERQGEEVAVAWDIKDEYIDLKSLRLEHKAAGDDSFWSDVQTTPGLTGQARFRPGHTGSVKVRLKIADLAKNTTSVEKEVPGLAVSSTFSPPPAPSVTPINPLPAPSVTPISAGSTGGATLTSTPDLRTVPPPAPWSPPPARDSNYPQSGSQVLVASNTTADPGGSPFNRSPDGRAVLPRDIEYVSAPQISLDCEVHEPLSGILKKELWATEDGGVNWKVLTTSTDGKANTITATLPHDGLFGLKLVVYSRAGLDNGIPRSGDWPDMNIELDTQPPVVELYVPKPDPSKPNTLTISWKVTDKNLGPTPVTLEWAKEQDGPWTKIFTGLPAAGSHPWVIQPNMPFLVYIKVTAEDRAGNQMWVRSPKEILIDLHRPEGKVKGISKTAPIQPVSQLMPTSSTQVPPATTSSQSVTPSSQVMPVASGTQGIPFMAGQ